MGSKHLETDETDESTRLRPRAFIFFSVFGTRDEALALVFDILLYDLYVSFFYPSFILYRGNILRLPTKLRQKLQKLQNSDKTRTTYNDL